MTDLEQTNAHEQPAEGAAPQEPDSTASESLQGGGVTPQLEAALAKLPPGDAELVRQDIAQRNAAYTKSQQSLAAQKKALERDVQLAGVLRQCMKDPEFNEYLEARNNGQLSTYFRRKAGGAASGQDHSENQDNQIAHVALDEHGGEMSDQSSPTGTDAELRRRVEMIERQAMEAQKQAEIAAFTEKYPDYEEYLPVMQSLRQQLPGASLEHLYLVSEGMVKRGQSQASAQSQAEAQQEQTDHSAAPASSSPPLPVGEARTSSTPVGEGAFSMEEAFAQAKAELGIQGDVQLSFDGQ